MYPFATVKPASKIQVGDLARPLHDEGSFARVIDVVGGRPVLSGDAGGIPPLCSVWEVQS